MITTILKVHSDLAEHLEHLEGIFDYMLTGDFTQVRPSALHAQLMSVNKLITEAKLIALQACLVDRALSHLNTD